MEPTIAEIVFYAVLAALALAFFVAIHFADHDASIDITEHQRRDWEREEKRRNR